MDVGHVLLFYFVNNIVVILGTIPTSYYLSIFTGTYMMCTVEEKMVSIFVSMALMEFAVHGIAKTLVNRSIKCTYMIMLSDRYLMSCLTVKHQIINSRQMNGISTQPHKVLLLF